MRTQRTFLFIEPLSIRVSWALARSNAGDKSVDCTRCWRFEIQFDLRVPVAFQGQYGVNGNGDIGDKWTPPGSAINLGGFQTDSFGAGTWLSDFTTLSLNTLNHVIHIST